MLTVPALLGFIASIFPFWFHWVRRQRSMPQRQLTVDTTCSISEKPNNPTLPTSVTSEGVEKPKKIIESSMSSEPRKGGGVDVLLHNISHTDLVVTVTKCDSELDDDNIMARPKFSCFHEVCSRIYDKMALKAPDAHQILRHPVYSRHTWPRQPINRSHTNDDKLPVGFNLSGCDVTVDNSKQVNSEERGHLMSPSIFQSVCTDQLICIPVSVLNWFHLFIHIHTPLSLYLYHHCPISYLPPPPPL